MYDVPGSLPERVWRMTRTTRVDGEVIARRAVVGVEELLEWVVDGDWRIQSPVRTWI